MKVEYKLLHTSDLQKIEYLVLPDNMKYSVTARCMFNRQHETAMLFSEWGPIIDLFALEHAPEGCTEVFYQASIDKGQDQDWAFRLAFYFRKTTTERIVQIPLADYLTMPLISEEKK